MSFNSSSAFLSNLLYFALCLVTRLVGYVHVRFIPKLELRYPLPIDSEGGDCDHSSCGVLSNSEQSGFELL